MIGSFQDRVNEWMKECFGPEISADRTERNHRFIEEALELVQACGCTASEAHQLVDYVFNRPDGDINQEVGGVMVTLAALCLANGFDMRSAGYLELARVWTKIDVIREKQASKPKHSPLPAAPQPADSAPADLLADLVARFSKALLAKLRLAQANGRSGWDRNDWEKQCQEGLLRHLEKGDPRDVAAYCAFMWHHGWITIAPASPSVPAVVREDAARYHRLRILGCAPGQTEHLRTGSVMRFTNLDAYVDADRAAHPSRGEAAASLSSPPPVSASVREALENCLGCITAAESEGLHELIAELRGSTDSVDRLIDLVERRLLWVRDYALAALSSEPSAS